jgi:SagB-type dehydrogenase family enzyme
MARNIGVDFIEKTRYEYLSDSDQSKGLKQPAVEYDYGVEERVIKLIPPDDIQTPKYYLRDAIEQRRSARSYSQEPFTLEELSYLLWCTQGVQRTATVKDSSGQENNRTYRTVPSAGARHPFETYLFINKVEGLEAGMYRFKAVDHGLVEVMKDPSLASAIVNGCLGQVWMARAAVIFIWVADVRRMTWRYVERGYRYMFLDAGHVCQNLYLAAQSIDAGVCAVAAYDDDKMNELLGLDGEKRFVIYIGATGKTHPADEVA